MIDYQQLESVRKDIEKAALLIAGADFRILRAAPEDISASERRELVQIAYLAKNAETTLDAVQDLLDVFLNWSD